MATAMVTVMAAVAVAVVAMGTAIAAKPKYYLCSRCKGCFIFMSV
jgi:hypothetical protein